MLLGGLWHGASWNFAVWRGLHGSLLTFERMQGKAAPYWRLPAPLRIAATFVVVLVTWVFFRAADLSSAGRYLNSMAGFGEPHGTAGLLTGIVYQPYYFVTFAVAAIVTWGCPQTWDWSRTLTTPKAVAVTVAFVTATVMLTTQAFNPFIYFIF